MVTRPAARQAPGESPNRPRAFALEAPPVIEPETSDPVPAPKGPAAGIPAAGAPPARPLPPVDPAPRTQPAFPASTASAVALVSSKKGVAPAAETPEAARSSLGEPGPPTSAPAPAEASPISRSPVETAGKAALGVHTAEAAAGEVRFEVTPLQSEGGASRVQLVVRPENLGRVAVRLVERGGVVEIAVRSDTAVARTLLHDSLPALVGNLERRGWQVGQLPEEGAQSALDWWTSGGRERREPHPQPRRPPPPADTTFAFELE